MKAIERAIERGYEALDGDQSGVTGRYRDRHETESACILTITSVEQASRVVAWIDDRIKGKTIVEVGAGVGIFALALAKRAAHVYAIESDPCWTWAFVQHLYETKPSNLTWIFGQAEELRGRIGGDIAIVLTRSGIPRMRKIARFFAPEVIMLYQDYWKKDADEMRGRLDEGES